MLITNPPIHPGEILRTEFMEPPNLTPGKIARAIGVPRTRIERRIRKQTALTADTAARLGRYLGTCGQAMTPRSRIWTRTCSARWTRSCRGRSRRRGTKRREGRAEGVTWGPWLVFCRERGA